MYSQKHAWFVMWRHKILIIFASTHPSVYNHPTFLAIFLFFGKLPYFLKLMPFLKEKSYSNELGGIEKIFSSRLLTSCDNISENGVILVKRWTKTFVLGCIGSKEKNFVIKNVFRLWLNNLE